MSGSDGKICVSVCAETADEVIEQIKRAANLADVVEIRFDCLNKSEIDSFYAKLGRQWQINDKIPLITTFRTKEQGGFRRITEEERDFFWNSGNEIGWADCEEDIIEDSWSWLWDARICSFHDFAGVPENLKAIYQRLKATDADAVKIAVQTNDISDAIPIWKLLERAKSENKKIIPIAMGESGKWTRILGLAHGAFMTYASLDNGNQTAPGQVSAHDLTEVYRVKKLDEDTEVYGILGGNTSVSMSPYIHNAAFKFHHLNAVFVPLQAQNLDEFMRRMVKPETREIDLNFRGFAVTIPHKQRIVKHLDFVDETARKIGAVNTLKIDKDGKLYGFNTDAAGFIEPLKNSYGDLRNARIAILGAGGAARACVYALKMEGAQVTVFARNLEKAKSLTEDFEVELRELAATVYKDFDILVNTTPLGMKGKVETETPAIAAQLAGLNLVYDLIYTPFQTRLLSEADKAGVPKIGGLAMLIAQAAAQQKIWTNLDAPIKEMSAAAFQRLS